MENDYKIPVRGIIINQVIPEEERSIDEFWRSRWAMQEKYIGLTRKKFPGKSIAGPAPRDRGLGDRPTKEDSSRPVQVRRKGKADERKGYLKHIS